MGISRDSMHKRRSTGGKRMQMRKKRKFELGRPPANTKIGARRVHTVRCRGGNLKYRGLRLDTGNFSWGSEGTTRKTRIIDTAYCASGNELVRTKTLVKGMIVSVDAVPFRTWYESHYAVPLAKKKGQKLTAEEEEKFAAVKQLSQKTQNKYVERQKLSALEPHMLEQFQTGRLYARITSRPGQSGRADGVLLESKELEFYRRKIKK